MKEKIENCTGNCHRLAKNYKNIEEYMTESDVRRLGYSGTFTGQIRNPQSTIGIVSISVALFRINLELNQRLLEWLVSERNREYFARQAFDPDPQAPVDECSQGCWCDDDWSIVEVHNTQTEYLLVSFTIPRFPFISVSVNMNIKFEAVTERASCTDR